MARSTWPEQKVQIYMWHFEVVVNLFSTFNRQKCKMGKEDKTTHLDKTYDYNIYKKSRHCVVQEGNS